MPSPLWDINTRKIVPCFFTVEAPASTCKWSKCYYRGLFKVCLHWLAARQSVVLHENVVGSLAKIEIDCSYWPDFQATKIASKCVDSCRLPVHGRSTRRSCCTTTRGQWGHLAPSNSRFLTGEYLCSSYVQLRCSALRLWLFVRPALRWFWLPKMQIRSLRIEFRSPLTFKSSHPQLQVLSLSQFDRFSGVTKVLCWLRATQGLGLMNLKFKPVSKEWLGHARRSIFEIAKLQVLQSRQLEIKDCALLPEL